MAELEKSNIDLNTRPVINNEDGSISTLRSITFEEDGKYINIPTLSKSGEQLSDEDAINTFHNTGEHLGIFDNEEEAVKNAEKKSEESGELHRNKYNIFQYEEENTSGNYVNFADTANNLYENRGYVNFADEAIKNNTLNDEYSKRLSEKLYGDSDVEAAKRLATEDYYNKQVDNASELALKTDNPKEVYKIFYDSFKQISPYVIKQLALQYEDAGTKMPDDEVASAIDEVNPERRIRLQNWKTNNEILFKRVKETRNNIFNEGILNAVVESGERFIPLVNTVKNQLAYGGDLSKLPTDKKIEAQNFNNKLLFEMTPAEYEVYSAMLTQAMLDAGNDSTAVADFWESLASTNTSWSNWEAAIDVAGILGAVKNIVRGGKATRNLSKAATAETKQLIKDGMAGGDEVIEATTPSMLKPGNTASDSVKTAQTLTNDAIDRQVLKDLSGLYKFSPDINQTDVDRKFQFFRNNFPNKYRFSAEEYNKIELAVEDADTVGVIINHAADSEEAFVSREAAETFAKKHFLPQDYSIEDAGDGYKIVAKLKMDDVGASLSEVSKGAEWEESGKPFKAPWWKRTFFGRVPDEFHEADVMTVNYRDAMLQKLEKYRHSVNRLNKKQQSVLDKLVDISEGEERWIDASEITKKFGVDDEQIIEAYESIKKANDGQFLIQNAQLRKSLDKRGYKLFGDRIAKEASGDINYNNIAVRDLDNNIYYGVGDLSGKIMDDLLKDDKVLLKLKNTDMSDMSMPFNYIIMSRDKAKYTELPEFIMQYVGGPRRYYSKGTMFLKQFRNTFLYNGREVVLRPAVIAATTDVKSLKKMADELNNALDIYKDYKQNRITKDVATRMLNESTAGNDFIHAASVKEFEKDWIKARKMNYHNHVEVLEDGQEMKAVRAARLRDANFFDDVEDYAANSLQNMIDDSGRFFNSRGPKLKTPFGDYAKTVSAKEIMSRTLSKLIYEDSTADYNHWYASKIRALFGDVIDPTYNTRGLTDKDFLKSVRFVEPSNKPQRDKITAARNAINHWRTLSLQHTDWDNRIEVYMKSLADWLGERFETFERGGRAWETVANLRPDKWARMVAFHIYLGCFNIRQLWLQAMGVSNAYMVHPTLAFKSARAYGPLRMAAMTDDPKKLKMLAKSMVKLGVESSEDEAIAAIEFMKSAGGYGALSNVAGDGLNLFDTNRFKSASTVFFKEGEMFNRIQDYYMSLKHISKQSGKSIKEIINDDKLRKAVIGHADDLYLWMSSASPLAIQRGGASLFSQFMRWPFAFLEAVTPASLGGAKAFTPAQKARLAIGNFMMFGTEGLLGIGLYDMAKDTLNIAPENQKIVDKGFVTFLLNNSGVPVDLSREGPGMFEPLLKVIKTSDATDVLTMIPSAYVFKSGSDTLKVLYQTAKALLPGADDEDLLNAWMHYAYNSKGLSSLRNYTKAAIAMSTGKIFSSNFEVIKDNVSTERAILTALGFKDIATSDYARAFTLISNEEEVYKDAMKDLIRLYNAANAAGHDPDSEAYKDYVAQSALIYDGLRNVNPHMYLRARRAMSKVISNSNINPNDKMELNVYKKAGFKPVQELKANIGAQK